MNGTLPIFISIGDVSDKGIPAALFMAVTKTLMKGIAAYGIEPADVLVKVNRELCKDNDSMMFVPLFCGILNCKTGELTYSNAGHNPPLMIHSDKRNGSMCQRDWFSGQWRMLTIRQRRQYYIPAIQYSYILMV